MDNNIEVESTALDVLPDQPRFPRLLDRELHFANGVRDFTADVDECVVGANSEGRDDHALDQGVRVGHHDGNVLARPRLGLVRVHHKVVRLAVALRNETPLQAGGKARSAAPSQTGVFYGRDDVVRIATECLAQRLIATHGSVAIEGIKVGAIPMFGDNRSQWRSH